MPRRSRFGLGAGGSGSVPSTANARSIWPTNRREASGAASPATASTPAFAMSRIGRSSPMKSGRSRPSALARTTTSVNASNASWRARSMPFADAKLIASTSANPRLSAWSSHTVAT
ncbi:hypothetical protein [Glycomyces paridis]|uniref:hypothetical protein n=1 Tax=Glycomyces paridis TaxID=2126555 RepID=UPI00195EA857|nr:hypothetical protein [Glycomyces paridis]